MKQYILFISISLLTGCISEKKIDRKYYTIEIPASQFPVSNDSTPLINKSLEVSQVEINPVYEKTQIVNRINSNEINYFIYHQWAVQPAEAAKNLITGYLEATNIFKSVNSGSILTASDYTMVTSINILELVEIQKSFTAHINLEFKIFDNSDNQVIISQKADRTRALQQKDINLFAEQVSNLIFEELNKFAILIKDKKYLFSGSH